MLSHMVASTTCLSESYKVHTLPLQLIDEMNTPDNGGISGHRSIATTPILINVIFMSIVDCIPVCRSGDFLIPATMNYGSCVICSVAVFRFRLLSYCAYSFPVRSYDWKHDQPVKW